MGRIGTIKSFVRTFRRGSNVSDVKIDIGGGEILLSEHFADSGGDAFPLNTDYVLTVPVPKAGGKAVVGYLDPLNEPKSMPGDKRIYARDPATGLVVVDVWLESSGAAKTTNDNGTFALSPDGSIEGMNANGTFKLEAGGNFIVNGVVIDTSGNITSPAKIDALVGEFTTSLLAASKEIAGHAHLAGTPPGSTGPNT